MLTGTSASETNRLLAFKTITPSVGERVAGFEGVREHGTNDGIVAGFKFGRALNAKQREGFLAKCLSEVKARNHRIAGDFGRDDLTEMGVSLVPTVLELLAEAQRQEAERLARERREQRERKDYVGNRIVVRQPVPSERPRHPSPRTASA